MRAFMNTVNRRRLVRVGGIALVMLVVVASAPSRVPGSTVAVKPKVFFDDFSYGRFDPLLQFWQHGWRIRSAQGWPGMAGASWSTGDVSFISDRAHTGNRLLRLTSVTDGTAAGTTQVQICQRRKFFKGTYATRIRFFDGPSFGQDGDQVVETFYAISPLEAPLDPNYSELDWEYLPNGGWGVTAPTLFVTTWETAQLDPYVADNTYTTTTGSLDGWHTLVLQVARGDVRYYLDGTLLASHGGKYYPEVPMSINYNLWFIEGGLLVPGGNPRHYHEDVDWAYHQAGVVLSPGAVAAQIAKLRKSHITFRDTVPAERPPLDSPCNF
jgi:hypothetical protein